MTYLCAICGRPATEHHDPTWKLPQPMPVPDNSAPIPAVADAAGSSGATPTQRALAQDIAEHVFPSVGAAPRDERARETDAITFEELRALRFAADSARYAEDADLLHSLYDKLDRRAARSAAGGAT